MFHANSVPYRICTSRTVIRCWNPKDAALIQSAINASVDSLLPWLPWAKDEPKDYTSKIDLLRYFRGSFDLGKDFVYGIFNADESEVLGGCGLHTRAGKYAFEIGYWVNKDYQNKGYATEITRGLVKTAFELSDIDHINIHCDVDNAASLRVIEKVGFRKEGVLLHEQKDADGVFRDLVVAVLLRDDYLSSGIKDDRIMVYDAIDQELLA